MNTYTKTFKEIGIKDLSQVGWKISSLGEICSKLSSKGILVPDGFAIPAFAFEDFLSKNALSPKLRVSDG